MSEDRLTASKMFAVEMLRGALQDGSLPLGNLLKNSWRQMSLKVVPPTNGTKPTENYFRYEITLSVHGFSSEIEARGFVDRENGEWATGNCFITIPAIDPSLRWSFRGQLEGGKVTVRCIKYLSADTL